MTRGNEKAELKSARDYDPLLTTEEAADLLRLSTSWLAKARMRGDGPPFRKITWLRPLSREHACSVGEIFSSDCRRRLAITNDGPA
jgi:hypothetical protein